MGLTPRVWKHSPGFVSFLFNVAPFCVVSLFSLLAKRKAGRISGSSLLPFLLFWCFIMCLGCEAKEFHIFCTLFYRFTVRTEP